MLYLYRSVEMKVLSVIKKGFDIISDNMQTAQAQIHAAQEEAQNWSLKQTLSMIESTSGINRFGYKKALDTKLPAASDNELKEIFKEAYYQQNVKIIACIRGEMISRGLLFEDSDGKLKTSFE